MIPCSIAKKISLFSFLIVQGCSNSTNKLISEKLTVKELNKEIKKDTCFADVYNIILKNNDTILKTDVQKSKYYDLTYNEVLQCYKKVIDTNYTNKYWTSYFEEWVNKHIDSLTLYDYQKHKLDSVYSEKLGKPFDFLIIDNELDIFFNPSEKH